MDVYVKDVSYKNIKPEDRNELLKNLNTYIDDEVKVDFIILEPFHKSDSQIIPGRMNVTKFYPHKELDHVIVMEVFPNMLNINIDINHLESIRINNKMHSITIYFDGNFKKELRIWLK